MILSKIRTQQNHETWSNSIELYDFVFLQWWFWNNSSIGKGVVFVSRHAMIYRYTPRVKRIFRFEIIWIDIDELKQVFTAWTCRYRFKWLELIKSTVKNVYLKFNLRIHNWNSKHWDLSFDAPIHFMILGLWKNFSFINFMLE